MTRVLRLVDRETTASGGHRLTDEVYERRWLEKIRSKLVSNERGCLIWQGSVNTFGYPQAAWRGNTRIITRRLYEVVHKIILDRWIYVCHSCDERRCMNIEHMWLGKPKDNTHDMLAKGRHAEQKVTHCPAGHAYDDVNTYWHRTPRGTMARNCKTCQRLRHQRRHRENRELLNTRQRERRRKRAALSRGVGS